MQNLVFLLCHAGLACPECNEGIRHLIDKKHIIRFRLKGRNDKLQNPLDLQNPQDLWNL